MTCFYVFCTLFLQQLSLDEVFPLELLCASATFFKMVHVQSLRNSMFYINVQPHSLNQVTLIN